MKKQKVEILYQDESIVVVNKPSGLLSVPDRFDVNIPNLKHLLAEIFGQTVRTVHRLDRDTSGVICFAFTEDAHRHLSQQFSAHTPRKTYWALVEGALAVAEGTIDYPLVEDPRKPGLMMIAAKGLEAHTTYQVLQQYQSVAWVAVNIFTGRTHQIRVHLRAIGHPLVGDPFYGQRAAFLVSSIKGKKFRLGKHATEQPLLERTALHAAQLAFLHPATEALVEFEAPLPKDLRAVLQQLEKWDSLTPKNKPEW